MTAPNMGRIMEPLERSLQNCTLNHETNGGGGGGGVAEEGRSADNNLLNIVSDKAMELNSNLSLPYHWEQCLEIKTGEIYYINRRNGMKASEDPRTVAAYGGGFYSDDDDDYDEEEEDDDDDDSLYDSESSVSSYNKNSRSSSSSNKKDMENVLVVAGCKRCLMYSMVPKQVEYCPKCNDHLLHFDDRSQTSFP